MMKADRESFEAGKMTMHCPKCGGPNGTNWKAYEMPEKCPFCGYEGIVGVSDKGDVAFCL